MKYGFVGSHGVGKSAAAHFLAAKLKKEDPTKAIKVLEESVRIISKLAEINSLSFVKLSILDSLFQQELFNISYNTIICDRIPLDYLVYAEYFSKKIPYEYKMLAVENALKFDKIYFIRPDSTPIADDGFRLTNIEERNNIDELFKDMLVSWNIAFEEARTEDIFK